MLAAPEIAEAIVGAKDTFSVHEPPPAMLPPQLSVSEKSPLMTKFTACADAPLFVTVTDFAAAVTPTIVFANVNVAGETAICAEEFTLAAANNAEMNATL